MSVTFQRTSSHPLACVGWLGFDHRDFTWTYMRHWTYQPEELRNEPKFRTRKEFENLLRSIGYNTIYYHHKHILYNTK